MPRGYVKPSLRTRLETIADLEGLEGYTETVEFLVRDYNTFPPGYPGGYVRLREEYAAHLEDVASKDVSEEVGRRCHPDVFIRGKGVRIERIREEWGRYAAKRLAPLDREFQEAGQRSGGEELVEHERDED